ncbi:hypothetical protein J7400_19500 [Shimia sp. R9_2]|uniref:hypothetical protein n=1 Tax=Shimia sp. R9_2 TaxID=2821112 RepID=UPI001ADAE3DF|nr:hypothetical protein [Shimia sp. R9_2]MBO9398865.1 hypothetical protein [Shimia sp. R9_2]
MKLCLVYFGRNEVPYTSPLSLPETDRLCNALAPHLPDAEWSLLDASKGNVPISDAYDAYFIVGCGRGKRSYDYQQKLNFLVRELNGLRIKTIGVFHGFHAVTLALGGSVAKRPSNYQTHLSPLKSQAANHLTLVETNPGGETQFVEQVMQVPKGAKLVLTKKYRPISGYTLDSYLLAIEQPFADFTGHIGTLRKGYGSAVTVADLSAATTPIAIQMIADFLQSQPPLTLACA